jgi:hypothetical protein
MRSTRFGLLLVVCVLTVGFICGCAPKEPERAALVSCAHAAENLTVLDSVIGESLWRGYAGGVLFNVSELSPTVYPSEARLVALRMGWRAWAFVVNSTAGLRNGSFYVVDLASYRGGGAVTLVERADCLSDPVVQEYTLSIDRNFSCTRDSECARHGDTVFHIDDLEGRLYERGLHPRDSGPGGHHTVPLPVEASIPACVAGKCRAALECSKCEAVKERFFNETIAAGGKFCPVDYDGATWPLICGELRRCGCVH